MNTLFTGQNRINLKTVDSTNNFAAKLTELPDWANGTVIVADFQSGGRGQRGRKWQSEPGQNLTCSFIFRLPFLSLDSLYQWNQAVALATCSALEKMGVDDLRIKWPNDLFQNGRKIAGILIENSAQGKSIHHSIVGIGINVNQTQFDELQASSVALATNSPGDLEKLIQTLCEELEKQYLMLRSGQTGSLQHYHERLFALNTWRDFEIDGKTHRAKLKQINQQGLGLFEFEDGEEKWFGHAEVKWHL
jgi:BirA family biotin operon repressor/biotin-[acetyl-CoA-carboxylase] ligase